ncbi:MAG TPA: DUF4235 domain-containing protein [Solirubrobacterales bacterium]|nr:DUF4235 domain-containing protein [Solirubrobacterales bacterium]
MKFLFAPIGIAAGLIAGLAAQKAFERLWAVIDDEEPPEPGDRAAPVPKLLAALAIEGAIFRLVKGLTDRGARKGFAALTGAWPGDDPAREEN